MSFGGRTFRAFRPSRYGRVDEFEEETEQVRQAMIRVYIERAAAQLPLFDPSDVASNLATDRGFLAT